MRARLVAALAIAAVGAGCNANTYVTLTLNRGTAPAGVQSVLLELARGDDARDRLTLPLANATLPTSLSLQLRGGGGSLFVYGEALDGSGITATGSTWVDADSGGDADLTLTFGSYGNTKTSGIFTALFEQLKVSVPAGGSVSDDTHSGLSGVSISCGSGLGSFCSGDYDTGSYVHLVADPIGFQGWSGDAGGCEGLGHECIVHMSRGRSLTADYTPP